VPYNVVVNMQICCTVQGRGSVSVLYSCGLTSSERYLCAWGEWDGMCGFGM